MNLGYRLGTLIVPRHIAPLPRTILDSPVYDQLIQSSAGAAICARLMQERLRYRSIFSPLLVRA